MPKSSIYSAVTRGHAQAVIPQKTFDRNSCLRSANKSRIIDRIKNSIIAPQKNRQPAYPKTPSKGSPKKLISPVTTASMTKFAPPREPLIRYYTFRGKNPNPTNPVPHETLDNRSKLIAKLRSKPGQIFCIETRSQRSHLKTYCPTKKAAKSTISCSSGESNKKPTPAPVAFTVNTQSSSLAVTSV
jgi:hypothetical protein